MDDRLPAHLEASSLLRRAEAAGGNGLLIVKGDRDRGALVLLIADRGVHVACLERELGRGGSYHWQATGPGARAGQAELSAWATKRRGSDPDLWLIELDIPHPERFIAETTATG